MTADPWCAALPVGNAQAAYLDLAGRAGITAANSEVTTSPGKDVLLVERFNRDIHEMLWQNGRALRDPRPQSINNIFAAEARSHPIGQQRPRPQSGNPGLPDDRKWSHHGAIRSKPNIRAQCSV